MGEINGGNIYTVLMGEGNGEVYTLMGCFNGEITCNKSNGKLMGRKN